MDKSFNRSYEEDDVKKSKNYWQHYCTRLSFKSFQCDTKHSKWNLNTKFIFNGSSVVERKRNKDKNVETMKTYKRIATTPNFELLKLKDGMTEDDELDKVMSKMFESEVEALE